MTILSEGSASCKFQFQSNGQVSEELLENKWIGCLRLAVQSKVNITALPELAKLVGKGKLGDNTTFNFMLNRPMKEKILGSDMGSKSVGQSWFRDLAP